MSKSNTDTCLNNGWFHIIYGISLSCIAFLRLVWSVQTGFLEYAMLIVGLCGIAWGLRLMKRHSTSSDREDETSDTVN